MSDFVFRETNDTFLGFNDSNSNIDIFAQIAKGDKGDPGSDFSLRGVVAAVADLPVAQEIGEAWLVGLAAPYDGYLWDGTQWVNIGPILQGEQGDTGAGVASGGSVGDVLIKRSSTDYDTEWSDVLGTKQNKLLEVTVNIFESTTDQEIGSLTDDNITASMKVVSAELANPLLQLKSWTIDTYDGGLTVTGRCSASTTVNLILAEV